LYAAGLRRTGIRRADLIRPLKLGTRYEKRLQLFGALPSNFLRV
jgi:hypothetical protein